MANNSTWAKVRAKLLAYHLPIALAFVVIFGFLVPWPGEEVGKAPVSTICVVVIFFLSGVKLKTDEVKAAAQAWKALIFGLLSILVITPLLGFALIEIPFDTNEFAIGLALFAAMPTTISSGVVLTQEAKGNVALSLGLTVATNLLATVTVPFVLQLFFTGSDASIDAVNLLVKLLLTILLPLIVGKVLRELSGHVRRFIAAHKLALKLASSGFLVLIPCVYRPIRGSHNSQSVLQVD